MDSRTIYIIFSFVFGTLVGSFLNVVILRLPRGLKLGGRSHCVHCGKTLSWPELVPVLSFIFLRGRCRSCGARISSRYAIIEIATGLLFASAFAYFSPTAFAEWLTLIKVWAIFSVLTAVFVIDLEHFLILDSVLITGFATVMVLNLSLDIARQVPVYAWQGVTIPSLAAAALCPLPFFIIWYFSSGQWMGFGDVKLAVFLGLALGWPLAWVGIFLGVCLGGLVGIGLLASGRKQLKSRVPFGTFLSAGAVLSLFYGMAVLGWYLSILGF